MKSQTYERLPEKQRLSKLEDRQLVLIATQQLPYVTTAYEVLANRHSSGLKAFCRHLCQSNSDAEDALQEALLRVYHNMHSFRRESSFKTWLYQIAHNECINLIRKRKNTTSLDNEINSETTEMLHNEDPSDSEFKRLLSMLDESDRTVVSLRVMADLEFNEIAAITHSGLSAVKMRYKRALQKLQDQMEKI